MIPTRLPTPVSAKGCIFEVWGRTVKSWCLTCEQALHLGETREVAQGQHMKGDVSARGRERMGASFLCPLWLPCVVSHNLLCSP